MNTWFRSAIYAGAALAVLGLASQAFPQTSQVLVVDDTSCNKLFPNTPGIDELNLGRGELVGVHVKGELTVEVTATDFVKNKPSEFKWVSQSTNGSAARVNAVIVRDSPRVSNLFPYPPGASFDSGLTGVKGQGIDRVRFCFGGPTVALLAFRECPWDDDELAASCAQSGPGFFIIHDPDNPDSPPAECHCAGVDVRACIDSPDAGEDACFLPGDEVTTTAGATVVNTVGSPVCTVYCYAIDGVRLCQQFCIP